MLILQERYVVCSVHGVCSPEDLLRGEVNEPGRENAFLRGAAAATTSILVPMLKATFRVTVSFYSLDSL